MRFCDKLPKLRKENNLSQEVLAEKLGISRQAVSKWESGSSYPDMEKMIEMCKILNCTLEDLLDDGSISNNQNSNNNSKFNFTNYVHDFLKFVTKMYNMFCAMKFKDKIKCLLELAFIAFVLWLLSFLVFSIFDSVIFRLLEDIPHLGSYMHFLIGNIFTIILIVISVIIFIHLFKIRYLDYYVTVEDQNAKEKVLEKPVDIKNEPNDKKEKIIIRDPKHSKFSFFEFLANIVVIMIKFILILCAIPAIIVFIILIMGLFMALYHIKFGIIFFFISLMALGLCGLNYVILEFIYNFIISKKQHFKRMFIIIITGFILVGAGLGLATCVYLNFDKTEDLPKEFQTNNTLNLDMTDNTVLEGSKVNYKIDNSIKDIKITTNSSLIDVNINEYQSKNYKILDLYSYYESNEMMNLLYYDIKHKNTRDYENIINDSITVTVSKETYDKLLQNHEKYINDDIDYNY